MTGREIARPIAAAPGLGSFVIALLGLGVAGYLTVDHYTASVVAACPQTATINCTKVTTSAWAYVGPIPVVLFGVAFFASMSVLCSPPAWRWRSLDAVRIAGGVAGVAAALYLIWAELFRVNAICLWCTAVHVCAVLLLASIVWTTTSTSARS